MRNIGTLTCKQNGTMYLLSILSAVLLSVKVPVEPDTTDLRIEEVTVTAVHRYQNPVASLNSVAVEAEQLNGQIPSSLSKGLSSIAGVQASSIGSGQSRPAIYSRHHWGIEVNAAWQHNLRREESEPVSHGYMPTPPDSRERQFGKHTATLNAAAKWLVTPRHTLRLGLQGEVQHNRRSGWGFIIPDFEQYGIGLYAGEEWRATRGLTLNAGIRYDFTHTDIHDYRDWYPTPVGDSAVHKLRSASLARDFHSFTWSAGLRYRHEGWLLRANIGKAFRTSIPKELGATPPVIDEGSFLPADCDIYYTGDTMQVHFVCSDDTEPGSFNIEIHNNFDHHTHGTSAVDCDEEEGGEHEHDEEEHHGEDESHDHGMVEGARVFSRDYAIVRGKTSDTIDVAIPVLTGVSEGDYHFMLRLTDRAGWQSIKAVAVHLRDFVE